MGIPIAYLRDDFQDNSIAPLWLVWPHAAAGSATRSEASGQAQIALPSSVAGGHRQAFFSAATYDITDDGSLPDLRFNIAQMVSTSVAAEVVLGLISDNQAVDGSVLTNQLRWYQVSGTLYAQKYTNGVTTDLYSVAWNATTYKHLRIREESGTVYFDSSTNGTSWTNRASPTVASLGFAITDLHVFIFAGCANVASPGTLKIEEVNALSLSTNWRYTQVVWSMQHRFRSITLTGGNAIGYIASSQDGVTWRYFAGPLGSASGLYNQLVEYSTQAAAEAMAVDIPPDTLGLGRWDLPAIIEARYFRLYHRSKAASTHYLYEFYPRRLVQADDIEAEKIRAIHIAANSITADRLSVIKLSAITANIGQLFIDLNGYLFQGTGSGTAAENAANPTTNAVTGLKIYHSGGIGKLSTYNTGVEQISLDTDGKFKAGAGNVVMDATGFNILGDSGVFQDTRAVNFRKSSDNSIFSQIKGYYASSNVLHLESLEGAGDNSVVELLAGGGGTNTQITLTAGDLASSTAVRITLKSDNTIHLDTTSVGTVQITGGLRANQNVGIGEPVNSVTRLHVKGASSTSSDYAMVLINSSSTAMFVVRNDNKIGFFGATEVARQTITGSRGGNAALASLLTGLASLGLITDSTT